MQWKNFIKNEMQKTYFKQIKKYLEEESKNYKIYPDYKDIFNAFKYCDFSNTKVVIIGQCPYHHGEAHGLAFSVLPNISIPPSLKNIFKEINTDLGVAHKFNSGYLKPWADQGFLLLNSFLTVRQGLPGSHSKIGWDIFTDSVISILNNRENPVVFMLWGNFAKEKEKIITNQNHLVLKSGHPSPFSAKFFYGCKHFSKANDFLLKNNLDPIDWLI